MMGTSFQVLLLYIISEISEFEKHEFIELPLSVLLALSLDFFN